MTTPSAPADPAAAEAVAQPAPAPPAQRVSPRSAAVSGKALEFVTQALLVTLLPRLLGPAEFGRLALALAIVTVGAVAISLGAPGAFARFVPAAPEARRAGLARSMTLRLLPLRAGQLALAGVAGGWLAYALPARFSGGDVAVLFLALAAEVTAILLAQVALGMGATWIWSFRIGARNAVLLVAIPLLLALGGTPDVMWTVTVGTLAGVLFAGSRVLPLVRHAERGVPVPDGARRFGRVAGAALLVGQLTYRGPVLATTFGGLAPEEVGYAGLAASIAMAIIYAVRELFTVSIPELVEVRARDPAEADLRLRRLGDRVLWGLVACSLAGVVALERLLPLVVGARFAPAATSLALVLAALPLVPPAALLWPATSLRLRPGLALLADGAALGAYIVLAALLMPAWGAAGALAAMLAAIAISAAVATRTVPAVAPPRMLVTGVAGAAVVLGLHALIRGAG